MTSIIILDARWKTAVKLNVDDDDNKKSTEKKTYRIDYDSKLAIYIPIIGICCLVFFLIQKIK